MANKTVDMSKLKQVLRLFKNGDLSNRKIAETVELDKNTVNKYINHMSFKPICTINRSFSCK